MEIKKKTALSFIAVQATEVVKTCAFLKFPHDVRANQPLENAHLERMGFHSSNTPPEQTFSHESPLTYSSPAEVQMRTKLLSPV